jgi:hypothetical protein
MGGHHARSRTNAGASALKPEALAKDDAHERRRPVRRRLLSSGEASV